MEVLGYYVAFFSSGTKLLHSLVEDRFTYGCAQGNLPCHSESFQTSQSSRSYNLTIATDSLWQRVHYV